jgi:phosphotriesterase-related protein
LETGAALEVHTEKGSEGEEIARTLVDFGLSPQKLILCHVDKRPDFRFHQNLLSAGITLEYDTFYRPKYQPKKNLWPLLERVIAAGYEDQIVIATDMAEPDFWARMGQGPGLTGLMGEIIPHLAEIGFHTNTIRKLVGGNIASQLSQILSSQQ